MVSMASPLPHLYFSIVHSIIGCQRGNFNCFFKHEVFLDFLKMQHFQQAPPFGCPAFQQVKAALLLWLRLRKRSCLKGFLRLFFLL